MKWIIGQEMDNWTRNRCLDKKWMIVQQLEHEIDY